MTSARRLAAVAAAGLLAVVVPRVASAQEGPEEPDDGWVVDATVAASGEVLQISGTIDPPTVAVVTDVVVSITRVTRPAISGCAVADHTEHLADADDGEPPGPPSPDDPTPGEATFDFDVPVRCNGRYEIALVSAEGDGPGSDDDVDVDPDPAEPRPLGGASVDVAPPDVQSVASRFDPASRHAVLAFVPPAGYGTATGCTTSTATAPPDFAGYAIYRALGTAEFPATPIATVAPGSQCYVDELPADAPLGQYRYKVLAARTGTNGLVYSAGGTTAVTTVAVGAAPPSTTATTARPPAGGTGAPAAPGVGAVSAGLTPPSTEPELLEDGTFDETLDFEEPGEEAAEVPEDAEAFLDFVPSPGPGILVPFAIAECLAVWAFHLRYLARRADDGF